MTDATNISAQVSTSVSPDPMRAELLAPAGDWDCIRAAAENRGRRSYFGLQDGFNARARAANFSTHDLFAVMEYLHLRQMRGYVTLNTLAFSDELAQIEHLVGLLTAAGVDALLVQDVGAARLIRQVSPELPLHASTQMTLTSAECIAAVRDLNLRRVVLPRELSIREIAAIHSESPVELEAFVHGALCVAYSGQCLTSESLGGRSANRGQCAQACRLPYELICDGETRDLGAMRYLLSPTDLAGYEQIPQLLAAGVVSFKIEGRLKTADYVANIVAHYRRALDHALAGQPVTFTATDVREMELSFSRGFTPGWLEGNDHKRLVPGVSSTKRGVQLGTIRSVQSGRLLVELTSPCSRGDGVVVEGDRLANEELGGRLYGIRLQGRDVAEAGAGAFAELELARPIPAELECVGLKLYKTDDPRLTQRLRETYTQADPVRKQTVSLHVVARPGEALSVVATTSRGAIEAVVSDEVLPVAHKRPCTQEMLTEQFSRLGHTVYRLDVLTCDIAGQPMVPLSLLSRVRQQMIQRLDEQGRRTAPRLLPAEPQLPLMQSLIGRGRAAAHEDDRGASDEPQLQELSVLARNREQLQAALAARPRRIVADFADPREYREAVEQARSAGVALWLATTRIQKPGEMGLFKAIAKLAPDGVLARNLSGLQSFRELGIPVAADFSLNVTNEFTAEWLREHGAAWVTASYDLNREQLLELVKHVPPEWLEVVIHQHMPLFHMEHCVFCSVLSSGTNASNCGRPCDTHIVQLRDRAGVAHPLTADVGCRNTLFNAAAQSSAEIVPELQSRGITRFRLEFVHETPGDVTRTIGLYRSLLNGTTSGSDVWRSLKVLNRVGVTRGTLEDRPNPLTIL